MIEIPENFSKMTWFQLLVVCLKIIIYFDTADIEELNDQVGGSKALTDLAKGAVTEAATKTVSNAATSAVTSADPTGAAAKAISTATTAATNAAKAATNGAAAPAAAANGAAAPAATNGAKTDAPSAANGNTEAGNNTPSTNNTSGSSEATNTPAEGTEPTTNSKNKSALNNAFKTDMSDNKDIQNQRPGFLNNNLILFMIKQIMTLVRKIMKTVTGILSKLFAKFIFAATFPALPFFLIMGAMYSFVKYGAFKLREI